MSSCPALSTITQFFLLLWLLLWLLLYSIHCANITNSKSNKETQKTEGETTQGTIICFEKEVETGKKAT